ncbi:MAG: adenosylcobalamin-dependent ribonucleoside-diphosphate reductase [Candidatus Thiodiazotropha taylori]|uniref:Vitamin B12-dependent ribonucleotide reductase n=1 Tax=Candidatus Thiodiazotropha taylori TaxID=2792791 RepID=A0A9E4K9M6_9GAMM|nr:adenosylcobalamin-dependent ribonucleoside-diphosphate reductase [Candidatus Thiodiazotropha taylori]MCW4255102.1 adenosylcobalamin-dependent ribonucleoside-diphosphate reductase [Candidatus Thiodiazotropha taylori]
MNNRIYEGPSLSISQEIDTMKYRQEDETFDGKIKRIARSLSDDDQHRLDLEDILGEMRFLPAGRVQSAMGARKLVTAYNCFVSGEISDSMDSIMDRAKEAAETMRKGGGIGYDFSKIRPRGHLIKSLDSKASGPVSFMGIFDAVCQTIASSGHRRGAQMGVLRVDHPDIYEFVRAKRNSDKLTGFNVSVGVTDAFMEALKSDDDPFDLVFEGEVHATISARELWDEIMESTFDWAEPGILFLDRINENNNLFYCETISATNPCGEQPLPYYGACLLGSVNLTKYVNEVGFDTAQLKKDIPHIVRALDNVIDRTIYPLREQEDEAKNKRRMGIGVTGLANAGEMLGYSYGSREFLEFSEKVFKLLRNETYKASAYLAEEKGCFPLYKEDLLSSGFAKTLPYQIRKLIKKHGLRNSHLTSIAPTGTISLVADNISSGIEPTFSHYYDRTIQTFDGPIVERVEDYAYACGVKPVTANEITVQQHVEVLALAQHYTDSAVSKTCNVGDEVTFEEFKDVYYDAWKEGCKGITTFRAAGKRYGILNEVKDKAAVVTTEDCGWCDKAKELLTSNGVEFEEKARTDVEETYATYPQIWINDKHIGGYEELSKHFGLAEEEEGAQACFYDPVTGKKECE